MCACPFIEGAIYNERHTRQTATTTSSREEEEEKKQRSKQSTFDLNLLDVRPRRSGAFTKALFYSPGLFSFKSANLTRLNKIYVFQIEPGDRIKCSLINFNFELSH